MNANHRPAVDGVKKGGCSQLCECPTLLKSKDRYLRLSQLIIMNRNYYQDQEINCSCFDAQKKSISFVDYSPNTKVRFALHQSLNISVPKNIPFKKSLKRKTSNKITDQQKGANQCVMTKQMAIQTTTQRDPKLNHTPSKIKRNQKLQSQILNFSYFKNKENVNINTIHEKFTTPSQHSLFIPRPTSAAPILRIYQCFQKKNQAYISSKPQPQANNNNEQPNSQLSLSTEQHKVVVIPPKFWEIKPTLTSKLIDNPTEKEIGLSQRAIKTAITSKSIPLTSIKYLNSLIPKQIESFCQESASGLESEVIDRRRFAWPPKSIQGLEGQHFVQCFHVRQTSSFTDVTEHEAAHISQDNQSEDNQH